MTRNDKMKSANCRMGIMLNCLKTQNVPVGTVYLQCVHTAQFDILRCRHIDTGILQIVTSSPGMKRSLLDLFSPLPPSSTKTSIPCPFFSQRLRKSTADDFRNPSLSVLTDQRILLSMFKYMTNPTEIDKHCNGSIFCPRRKI